MSTKIEPTLGRVLWYTPDRNAGVNAQQAAIIARVNDDGTLNLTVSDPFGHPYGVQNVPLLQDGDETPAGGFYAEWMPYQKGQAAKTDAVIAEAGIATTSTDTTSTSTSPAASSSASIPPTASTGGPIPEGEPQHETVIERLEGGFEHLKEDVEHAFHHDKPEDSAT